MQGLGPAQALWLRGSSEGGEGPSCCSTSSPTRSHPVAVAELGRMAGRMLSMLYDVYTAVEESAADFTGGKCVCVRQRGERAPRASTCTSLGGHRGPTRV